MLRNLPLIFLGLLVIILSCNKSVEKNPLAGRWRAVYITDSYINPYTGVMVKDTVNDPMRGFIEFKTDGSFNLGDPAFYGTYSLTDSSAATRFTSSTIPAIYRQVQHFIYSKADSKRLYMKSGDINISVQVFNPNNTGEFRYANVILEELYYNVSN